jgi:hypothetical protein
MYTPVTGMATLARTPEQIRLEIRRAHTAHAEALARGEVDYASRITAHVAAYHWLLGDTDIAPCTGRRVPVITLRDLAIEQAEGRDHAEQNTHRYNDPARMYPEAVFDAICWARGEFDDPPSSDWVTGLDGPYPRGGAV